MRPFGVAVVNEREVDGGGRREGEEREREREGEIDFTFSLCLSLSLSLYLSLSLSLSWLRLDDSELLRTSLPFPVIYSVPILVLSHFSLSLSLSLVKRGEEVEERRWNGKGQEGVATYGGSV